MVKNSFQKNIAKLFIFLLPFRMLTALGVINNIFGAMADYLSFLIHFIGIILILLNGVANGKIRIKKDNVFSFFCSMVLVFMLTSFIMAGVIYIRFGNYNGNSPFVAVLKLSLDFVQYILIIFYCKNVFLLLSYSEINKCIHGSIVCLLIIGYLQLFIYLGMQTLLPFYKKLANILNLSTVMPTQAISLTLSEPSHAAILLGVYVIPFYMSQLLYTTERRVRLLIELLLWIPIIFFTQSTSTYLIVFSGVGVAMLIALFRRKTSALLRIFCLICLIGVLTIIINPEIIDTALGINFSYLLTDKVFNLSDQSTASRMVPLVVDWNVFLEYPLFGCGNGLQGYFYQYFSPSWVNHVHLDASVRTLLGGNGSGIANGVLFFPAVLSGYGVIGTVLMVVFFIKCLKKIIKNREQYRSFYYFYIIAFVPLLISGFKSEFVGIYYIWFVLSLPMVEINGGCQNHLM